MKWVIWQKWQNAGKPEHLKKEKKESYIQRDYVKNTSIEEKL